MFAFAHTLETPTTGPVGFIYGAVRAARATARAHFVIALPHHAFVVAREVLHHPHYLNLGPVVFRPYFDRIPLLHKFFSSRNPIAQLIRLHGVEKTAATNARGNALVVGHSIQIQPAFEKKAVLAKQAATLAAVMFAPSERVELLATFCIHAHLGF